MEDVDYMEGHRSDDYLERSGDGHASNDGMGSMNKLIYCSSLDHLRWFVPSYWPWACYLRRESLNSTDDRRYEITKWINEKCRGVVYAWNHCDTPEPGSLDWGSRVSPSGDITLYFMERDDHVLFLLSTDYKDWIL
jgi:hypothetical protein